MKYIKKFQDNTALETYKKSNFVAPHVYLDSNLNAVKYMEEYIPLEYISSTQTGGQYIDLGCHLMENTDDIRIDIKFNIKNRGLNSADQQGALICSQPEVSPYPGFVLRYSNANSEKSLHLQTKWNFTGCYWGSSTNKGTSKYLSYGSNYKVDNNIYEFSETLDNIPQSQVNNCTCTLFCALDSSNQPFRYVEADLYYLKFTKGETVIRDLVPVLDKHNIPGLYDKANRKFYKSQSDAEFEAGPIK